MNFISVVAQLLGESGFAALSWQQAVMILISFVLMYLAIKKQFEPLLLLPISFGIFLTNLPLTGMMEQTMGTDGLAHFTEGVLGVVYNAGVATELFPCIMFLAVGAMTDFGPLIANPISLLLGAAAQFGIYIAFIWPTSAACLPPLRLLPSASSAALTAPPPSTPPPSCAPPWCLPSPWPLTATWL